MLVSRHREFWFLLLFVLLYYYAKFCWAHPTTTDIDTTRGLQIAWMIDSDKLAGLNLTSHCNHKNNCANQLLDYLNEIHQDLVYANKTINIERISSRLVERLGDIESALDEYSIASKNSHDSLNRSIEHILAKYQYQHQDHNSTATTKTNNSNSNNIKQTVISVGDVVNQAVSSLETNTSKLMSSVPTQTMDMSKLASKQENVISRVDLLSQRHQRLMDDLSHAQDDMKGLADMNHDLNGGQCNTTIEYNAEQLEELIRQSSGVLSKQLDNNSTIAAHYRSLRARTEQITNLSRLFHDLSHGSTQVSKLIITRLINTTRYGHFDLFTNRQLNDGLQRMLTESSACFNSSLQTLDQLLDLKQSIASNDERESDEQLLLSESLKDLRNLNGKLDKLSTRLDKIRKETTKLKTGFLAAEPESSDNNNKLAVINLKNSTQELTSKGTLIASWFRQELVPRGKELIELVDTHLVKLANINDDIQIASNWTRILDLATRIIHSMPDEIQTINKTIANINRAIPTTSNTSLVNQVSSSPATGDMLQELAWPTKETCSALMNTTKYLRNTEQPKLAEKLVHLKSSVASSSLEIEQTKSHLNEALDMLKCLHSAQDEARKSFETIYRQLTTGTRGDINTYTTTPSSLSQDASVAIARVKSLEKSVDQLVRNWNLALAANAEDEQLSQDSLANQPTDSISLSTLKQTKENYENLHERLTRSIILTDVQNITQSASVGTRQSIESLGRKLDRARSLINRIKLGRCSSTSHSYHLDQRIAAKPKTNLIESFDTSKQANASPQFDGTLRFRLPDHLNGLSSFLAVSFLIRLNDTNINTNASMPLLLIGHTVNESKPNKHCTSQHQNSQPEILIELRSGHLVLSLSSKPNSAITNTTTITNTAELIRGGEQLVAGRIYRIGLVKLGNIVMLSMEPSDNINQTSVYKIASPTIPHLLDLSSTEIVIGAANLHHVNGRSDIGSVQIDKLEINSYRVSLWNNDNIVQQVAHNLDYIKRLHESQACEPLEWSPHNHSTTNNKSSSEPPKNPNDLDLQTSIKLGRLVSFGQPISNMTSSSFVQSINIADQHNGQLDELLIERDKADRQGGRQSQALQGHIRSLSLSFKTSQSNGLLLHHTCADHSSFLSIYTSGGRLMLAFNFDKKLRIESHISLSDGQWHHINLNLKQVNSTTANTTTSVTNNDEHMKMMMSTQNATKRFILSTQIDERSLYLHEFDLVGPISEMSSFDEPIGETVRSIAEHKRQEHSIASDGVDGDDTRSSKRLHEPWPGADDESDGSLKLNKSPASLRPHHPMKKLLYFGGVEDKYSPLLRSQQIPNNFHGCMADIIINGVWINFAKTKRMENVSLGVCHS